MHVLKHELVLRPELAEFGQVNALLQGVEQESLFLPETLLRARLVLEELFTNSIKHGFPQAHVPIEVPIRLSVGVLEGVLHVQYCDSGVGYNPLAPSMIAALMAMTEREIETREPGGLGCMLIQTMSDGAEYEYSAGRNKIYLLFKNRKGQQRQTGSL